MKKTLFAAIFALSAPQAFAIAGFGAHYAHNTGTLKKDSETFQIGTIAGAETASLTRSEASGLQGLGFKLWIDFLPVVDVEGTFNVTAIRYVPHLEIGGNNIPLEYAPEAPYNMVYDKASPIYGVFSGDVSITYPITSLPIVRPYAGLGVSYMVSTPLVDGKFVRDMDISQISLTDPGSENAIGEKLSETLKNMDYKTGIGGHAIAGARFQIMFVAIYANVKRYFGGGLDDKFNQGFVFELGGGLAI